MKVQNLFFSRPTNFVSCEIDVPGLGTLKLSDCLSQETIEAVCKEVETIARQKLNIFKPSEDQP